MTFKLMIEKNINLMIKKSFFNFLLMLELLRTSAYLKSLKILIIK
jgi:hypothetical protein